MDIFSAEQHSPKPSRSQASAMRPGQRPEQHSRTTRTSFLVRMFQALGKENTHRQHGLPFQRTIIIRVFLYLGFIPLHGLTPGTRKAQSLVVFPLTFVPPKSQSFMDSWSQSHVEFPHMLRIAPTGGRVITIIQTPLTSSTW